MEFIRLAARTHPEGMGGLVNDAVALYRDQVERKGERILDGIVSSS